MKECDDAQGVSYTGKYICRARNYNQGIET